MAQVLQRSLEGILLPLLSPGSARRLPAKPRRRLSSTRLRSHVPVFVDSTEIEAGGELFEGTRTHPKIDWYGQMVVALIGGLRNPRDAT